MLSRAKMNKIDGEIISSDKTMCKVGRNTHYIIHTTPTSIEIATLYWRTDKKISHQIATESSKTLTKHSSIGKHFVDKC